jgi:hypothetical protein
VKETRQEHQHTTNRQDGNQGPDSEQYKGGADQPVAVFSVSSLYGLCKISRDRSLKSKVKIVDIGGDLEHERPDSEAIVVECACEEMRQNERNNR